MKPDKARQRLDDVERAHLIDPRESFYAIDHFGAAPDLTDLVRRHWMPGWDLPEGESSTQEVLQYPVCLIVISDTYARFYGVQSGLSRTTLTGAGWASGVMLQPAAGRLVLGKDVSVVTDRFIEASEVIGGSIVDAVRAAMDDPTDPRCRRASADLLEGALRGWLPVDEDGLLVNAIVEAVESEPKVAYVRCNAGAASGSAQSGSSSVVGCTRRASGCARGPAIWPAWHTTWAMRTRRISRATSDVSRG